MKYLKYVTILVLLSSCKDNNNYPINIFENGEKQGIHIRLDSMGRLEMATFLNDKLEGEYILYHIGNLRIMRKELYKNNKENGQSYYYYSNGALMSQREWKNGKKIGYGMDWYETGETKSVLLYNSDGFLVMRKTFDKNGKLIKEE